MDFVSDIILFVSVIVYMIFVVKRDLQMLQQNSYRNERYVKWLKMNKDFVNKSRTICFIAICWFSYEQIFSKIGLTIVFAILTITLVKTKYKHSLVFTKRVWRMYSTELVLASIIIAVCGFMFKELIAATTAGIAICAISYLLTMATNWILKPVENAINQRYYNDAKRILGQMPNMKIIGITGSYGKTSTKHYLNRILSEHFSVLMTPGSFNTPMGVIRTVREMLEPYNEVFIVEMGAKNVGDIKEICDLVHPTMGLITAVGPQHLESFKSIENVQKTKFELVDALPSDGFAVVNNDFPYIANRVVNNVTTKRYAVNPDIEADYHAENITYDEHGTTFTIVGKDINLTITTKLLGECNISNLMGAIIIALKLGVPADKIKYAVSKIAQVEHRLNLKRTPGGITIIDDAFNSNPDGSRMALDVLGSMTKGKRIVITPGMIELGDKQEFYNKKFGEHIAETCDIAIVVGQYNRDAIVSGIKEKNMNNDRVHIVDTFNEAQTLLMSLAQAGDTVLYENDLPDTFK